MLTSAVIYKQRLCMKTRLYNYYIITKVKPLTKAVLENLYRVLPRT